MYPKNSQQPSTAKGQTKKDFLNPFQREELKKRLSEKFTKMYGLHNPALVKEEVDTFFRLNADVNAANLQRLEGMIKSKCAKSKSNAGSSASQHGNVTKGGAENGAREH
jgi:hypothetical protein